MELIIELGTETPTRILTRIKMSEYLSLPLGVNRTDWIETHINKLHSEAKDQILSLELKFTLVDKLLPELEIYFDTNMIAIRDLRQNLIHEIYAYIISQLMQSYECEYKNLKGTEYDFNRLIVIDHIKPSVRIINR